MTVVSCTTPQQKSTTMAMQMGATSSPVEGHILAGFSNEAIENQLRATCLRAEKRHLALLAPKWWQQWQLIIQYRSILGTPVPMLT